MGKKEVKTNAMRILDRKKISYEYQTYECDEFTDGIETADKLNLPHEQVYKTIVCKMRPTMPRGMPTILQLHMEAFRSLLRTWRPSLPG